jgi:hypothetical protein
VWQALPAPRTVLYIMSGLNLPSSRELSAMSMTYAQAEVRGMYRSGELTSTLGGRYFWPPWIWQARVAHQGSAQLLAQVIGPMMACCTQHEHSCSTGSRCLCQALPSLIVHLLRLPCERPLLEVRRQQHQEFESDCSARQPQAQVTNSRGCNCKGQGSQTTHHTVMRWQSGSSGHPLTTTQCAAACPGHIVAPSFDSVTSLHPQKEKACVKNKGSCHDDNANFRSTRLDYLL